MRHSRLAIALAFALVATPAHASTIVYDNLTTALGIFLGDFAYLEVADDVTLGPGGRLLESLSIAYKGLNFDGDETLTVTLYAMDGPPTSGSFGFNTPGTVLYTNTTSIVETPGTTLTFGGLSVLNVILPDTVAIGVAFRGVEFDPTGASANAGPLLYDPPTVGSSLNDYWVKGWPDPGDPWALFTFGGTPPVNFGAQITVSAPEPATLGLVVVGLAGVFARRARRGRARR